MYTIPYQKICHNIEKYTLVQLAGETADARRRIANRRADEILGMLQLARQLPNAYALINFLRSHLDYLEKEIAGQ